MDQKNFKFIVLIVLAIFIGVIVHRGTIQQDILKDIQSKQGELLKKQSLQVSPVDTMVAVISNQKQLIQKVKALEEQMQTLQAGIKTANAPAAPQRPAQPSDEYTKVYNIPIDHSYIHGDKNAPITIVEFTDLQCPYCSRFHGPAEEVLAAYPTQVKIVLKNFPLSFHKHSRSAAKAALAAGEQGKYWEMVDLLLKNQKALGEEKYRELAQELGLNVKTFEKDYKEKDAEWEKYINADMQLGSKVGVRGTPTFFLNGKKTRARDLASYKREIDAILKGK